MRAIVALTLALTLIPTFARAQTQTCSPLHCRAAALLSTAAKAWGAGSAAHTLLAEATASLSGPAVLFHRQLPFGPTAVVAAESDRFLLVVTPSGDVFCRGDGGCPPPRESLPDYEPETDMYAPTGVGASGHLLLDLGTRDALGLVVVYGAADGHAASIGVHPLTRNALALEPLLVATGLADVDGDGHPDALVEDTFGMTQPEMSYVRWLDVRFWTPAGQFLADPRRARAFHRPRLRQAMERLSEGPPWVEPPGPDGREAFCLGLTEPAILAHAHQSRGGHSVRSVARRTRTWSAALGRTPKWRSEWRTRCPRAAAVLSCLGARTDGSPATFERCLAQ